MQTTTRGSPALCPVFSGPVVKFRSVPKCDASCGLVRCVVKVLKPIKKRKIKKEVQATTITLHPFASNRSQLIHLHPIASNRIHVYPLVSVLDSPCQLKVKVLMNLVGAPNTVRLLDMVSPISFSAEWHTHSSSVSAETSKPRFLAWYSSSLMPHHGRYIYHNSPPGLQYMCCPHFA